MTLSPLSEENIKTWRRLQVQDYFAYARDENGELTDRVGLGNKLVGDYDFTGKTGFVIGCGYGRELSWLLAKGASFVLGIDVSREVLRIAHDWMFSQNWGIPDDYDLAEWNQLDGLVGYINPFDFSYCFTVFQHVTQEIVRYYIDLSGKLIKPGGRVFHQFFCNEGDEVGEVELSTNEEPHHSGYTRGQLERWYSKAGFEVDVEPLSPYYFVRAIKL